MTCLCLFSFQVVLLLGEWYCKHNEYVCKDHLPLPRNLCTNDFQSQKISARTNVRRAFRFLAIQVLSGFWDSLGTNFGVILVTFSWFGVQQTRQMTSKVRILTYLAKSDEIAPPQAHLTCNPIEPARADRMSAVCLFLRSRGGLWGHFGTLWLTFWGFLVTLGALFLIFGGPGGRLEMWWFFRGTLEGPRLRQPTQGRVTGWSVGPSKQVTDHRWPSSRQLKADTRLANC